MESNNNLKGKVYRNENAWKIFSTCIETLNPSKVFVIVDEITNKQCLPYFLQKYNSEKKIEIISIPSGESYKTIQTSLIIWKSLSTKGADRNSLIINLGGGVITDLGGFIASTFNRGLAFINIPTTLLAMVDASVGGKNGVDLGHIKNQIGVINLPEIVIVDTTFLKTLPTVQLHSGIAEMLKHGIIHSNEKWERVKEIDITDAANFEELLWDSIKIKKEIVEKDPFEKNLRKSLNYGHTLGHAIESYFMENKDKNGLLHGEAVAVGIILATYISKEMLGFSEEKLLDISKSVLKFFPKQNFTENDIEAIIKLMVFDKKNRNGEVLFVLLEDIGHCKTDLKVDKELIFNSFEYYKNL